MFVSDERRLLFIHVQKTGGVTVEQRLTELLPNGSPHLGNIQRHAPLRAILKNHPEVRDYFTFGFVRNPWSRMLSWWRMIERMRDLAQAGDPRAVAHLHGARRNKFWADLAENCPDFQTFVNERMPAQARLHRPQIDYLVARHRVPDFVGRLESLEDDLRAIVARFDLPWEPLPRRNADPHPPGSYREFYDDTMRDRVEEHFLKDVQYFGYEF